MAGLRRALIFLSSQPSVSGCSAMSRPVSLKSRINCSPEYGPREGLSSIAEHRFLTLETRDNGHPGY